MATQINGSRLHLRWFSGAFWVLTVCFLALTATGPASAASTASSEPPTQVYFIRGFLGVFSTGFDSMAKSLSKDKIKAEVYGHLGGSSVRAKIIRQYGQSKRKKPIILVGHSFGGNAVFEVAANLRKKNIPVALLISVDPTRAGPLSSNVKRYVNYFFADNGLGSELKPGSGVPKSRIKNINMRKRVDVAGVGDDHWTVTNNAALRREILSAVKSAAR